MKGNHQKQAGSNMSWNKTGSWEESQMFSSLQLETIMDPTTSMHTDCGEMVQALLGRSPFPVYLAPSTSGFWPLKSKDDSLHCPHFGNEIAFNYMLARPCWPLSSLLCRCSNNWSQTTPAVGTNPADRGSQFTVWHVLDHFCSQLAEHLEWKDVIPGRAAASFQQASPSSKFTAPLQCPAQTFTFSHQRELNKWRGSGQSNAIYISRDLSEHLHPLEWRFNCFWFN